MVAPDPEQLALRIDGDVVGLVSRTRRTINRAVTCQAFPRCEGGARQLGDLSVDDPPAELVL